ncbi:MAG: hypothetical protein EA384_16725 [Spirochaetaceae bacterium]|nr:MAG: hypothetical protein EA384_16725 [Spirochaetaceae bacterium]
MIEKALWELYEDLRELDRLLTQRYYPPIRRALQETGYPYSSIDDDAIPIESRWEPTVSRDAFGAAELPEQLLL